MREEVLRARKFKRTDLLEEKVKEVNDPKLVLNITYHPAFSKIKDILSRIHLLLTPNEEYKRVFSNIPVIGFKRGKSL